MTATINILKQRIPQILESESYLDKKKRIISEYNDKEQKLMNAFEEKIKKDNFSLGQVKVGQVARPEMIPLIDNKPVPIYQLEEQVQNGKLTKEQAQETLKKYNEYQLKLL